MTAFLSWIAQLPPLAQIPLVVLAFALVVGAILFFVEVAPRAGRRYTWIRFAVALLVPALAFLALGSVLWAAAVGAAIGGVLFILDYRSKQGVGYFLQLVAFVGPAVVLLLIGLIYPTISTIVAAFMNSRGTRFVGLENFAWIFNPDGPGIRVVLNTIVWVLVAPAASTAIGLAYAVFIDKSRGEKVFKVLVFMPMAISFVGASIIWRFVYAARPAGQEQIGILNQVIVWLGGQPIQFLQSAPWNNFFLIVILIWVQTGFAMVVLSSAIKGVPVEQLEAAELDGTNGWQRFVNVTLPGIRSSLVVVLVYISVSSLKVFDIVRTMTAGANETSVIANEMYTQWKGFEVGRSAAFAVVLFLLVMPIIVYNARQIQNQRGIR